MGHLPKYLKVVEAPINGWSLGGEHSHTLQWEKGKGFLRYDLPRVFIYPIDLKLEVRPGVRRGSGTRLGVEDQVVFIRAVRDGKVIDLAGVIQPPALVISN